MKYFVEHSVLFTDGTRTAPYRLLRKWKTVKGALRSGEQHALAVGQRYNNVHAHAVVVLDENGHFVTNLAATIRLI